MDHVARTVCMYVCETRTMGVGVALDCGCVAKAVSIGGLSN